MKRQKAFLIVSLLGILIALPAFAQVDSPGVPVSPRLAAIGGLHAADVGGFESLFTNPAGLADLDSSWSFSRIALNAAGPIFSIANMALGGQDIMSNLTSLLDDSGRLYTAMDLATPIAFGYVGGGLGVGVFNRTYMVVNAPSLASDAYLNVGEEMLMVGGYARRFDLGNGHRLDAGLSLKGFLRNEFAWTGALTDITTAFSDITGTIPYNIVTGLSLSAGVLWSFSDFAVGLVGRDAFAPYISSTYSSYNAFKADPSASKTDTETGLLDADVSLGFRWNPQWNFLVRSGSKLLLLADYRNILGLFRVLDRNPILEVSLGAEATLLEILSLRAGIQDCLPAAGFGLDLQYFKLSLSMYGEELGLEPGSRSVFNLAFAIDFIY
jgi:hypothetical protein